MSGGIRSGHLSGGELAWLLQQNIPTKLKDTAGYGREISTRCFLGRAQVRDDLDIGYRACIIFGASEVVQSWIDLRFRWSSSFPLEQQVLFGESPTFVYEYSNIVNKKIS